MVKVLVEEAVEAVVGAVLVAIEVILLLDS